MNLEEMKINLRTLWIEDYSNLPDWVDSENVIYKIENLVNHKVYIGQTVYFYGRFCMGSLSHLGTLKSTCINNYTSTILYNAIRKYHSRNFEVSIIEICESSDELNDREIYWISYYNSFGVKGYNMNIGGGYCNQFHTSETLEKACKSRAERYNGDPYGQLHTIKARKAAYESIAAQYNGDGYGQIHTSESIAASHETQRKNNGGLLPIEIKENRDKSYESNRRNHNGVLAWNTDDVYNTKAIGYINNYIQNIREWHPEFDGIQLDWKLYWTHMNATTYIGKRHTRRILNRLPNLRKDPRWTPEMENIFGYIEIHRKEYGI